MAARWCFGCFRIAALLQYLVGRSLRFLCLYSSVTHDMAQPLPLILCDAPIAAILWHGLGGHVSRLAQPESGRNTFMKLERCCHRARSVCVMDCGRLSTAWEAFKGSSWLGLQQGLKGEEETECTRVAGGTQRGLCRAIDRDSGI